MEMMAKSQAMNLGREKADGVEIGTFMEMLLVRNSHVLILFGGLSFFIKEEKAVWMED